MYRMQEFIETDMNAVSAFMRTHEFVTLIGNYNNNSVATQVPVMISEADGAVKLRGHIMKKTDHHIAFEHNPDALVLFTGPHCYVSSSWYSERSVGSTWNYMTVHLRGKIKLLDEEGTLSIIKDLTGKYESGQNSPEMVENMHPEYISKMVKGIAGFEIVAEEITPIFKLSQNRSDESYRNIITELEKTEEYNAMRVAEEMKKRRNKKDQH